MSLDTNVHVTNPKLSALQLAGKAVYEEQEEVLVCTTPLVISMEDTVVEVSKPQRRKYTPEEEMAKDVKLLLYCEISSQRIVKSLDVAAGFVSDVKMKKIHVDVPMRRFHLSTAMRLMELVFSAGD